MQLEFTTVDVFTDRKFGGNPLAVIRDARGLSPAQMQSIAAEFNLSETTFVLPPDDPSHTARVRIFTPRAELPFAGHPNIGTAFVLARAGTVFGRQVSGQIVFEEQAGRVEIDLLAEGGDITGARLAAPQSLSIGPKVSREAIAAACSIEAEAIEISGHEPCVASTGTPFVTVELKSRAALSVAAPAAEAFARHVPLDLAVGIQLYVQDGAGGSDIETRVFAPLQGVAEDPATGSANVNLIALLADLRPEPDLVLAKSISQGVDMGRQSVLHAEARKESGTVTASWIGGACVPMMEGTLEI